MLDLPEEEYMFSSSTVSNMTGGEYELAEKSPKLAEMESRFRSECEKRGFAVSFDCTADEPMEFRTLNYSTYAGMFLMYPLNPETCLRQTHSAFIEKTFLYPELDYIPTITNKVLGGLANKYVLKERENYKSSNAPSGIVVLPGQNILTTQICLNQVKRIAELDGVVFKPHPLTDQPLVDEFSRQVPNAIVLDKDLDLYSILPVVDTVYTTHASESALYGFVLGKNLVPIDAIQSRRRASFTHINYHLFFHQNDKSWLNKMLSSPCSGIIHPEVDKDWKLKMDLYLNYIIADRERVKNFFTL